jgi:hypothetical protein
MDSSAGSAVRSVAAIGLRRYSQRVAREGLNRSLPLTTRQDDVCYSRHSGQQFSVPHQDLGEIVSTLIDDREYDVARRAGSGVSKRCFAARARQAAQSLASEIRGSRYDPVRVMRQGCQRLGNASVQLRLHGQVPRPNRGRCRDRKDRRRLGLGAGRRPIVAWFTSNPAAPDPNCSGDTCSRDNSWTAGICSLARARCPLVQTDCQIAKDLPGAFDR